MGPDQKKWLKIRQKKIAKTKNAPKSVQKRPKNDPNRSKFAPKFAPKVKNGLKVNDI
jgi:hypothetical protein